MKYYFQLQFNRLERWFIQIGIHPILGSIIFIVISILLSLYLFSKTEFAHYIFSFFALSYIQNLSEKIRNDQLKVIFSKKEYIRIRLIENLIFAIPFVMFLCIKGHYFIGLGLFCISSLMAVWSRKTIVQQTLPTPFRKWPFEFIVGFRKSWWIVLAGYLLLAKVIQVENFNLALFTLAALFLLSLSFYSKPENIAFVWINVSTSSTFLWKKILSAIICSSILTIPIAVILCISFYEKWWLVLISQMLGYFILSSMVFAKYSAYPDEMSLPQVVLFGLCVWFPPLLLIVVPIFYIQSKRRLKPILE